MNDIRTICDFILHCGSPLNCNWVAESRVELKRSLECYYIDSNWVESGFWDDSPEKKLANLYLHIGNFWSTWTWSLPSSLVSPMKVGQCCACGCHGLKSVVGEGILCLLLWLPSWVAAPPLEVGRLFRGLDEWFKVLLYKIEQHVRRQLWVYEAGLDGTTDWVKNGRHNDSKRRDWS